MSMAAFIVGTILVLLTLAFFQAPILVWSMGVGGVLAGWSIGYAFSATTNIVLGTVFGVVAVILNIPALRRALVTDRILAIFRRILPDMTPTEKEAIDAGTVWFDRDIFSGKPDWEKFLATPEPKLTPEEQAFVDG